MTTRGCALLAPGYGGTAQQPILGVLASALAAEGFASQAVTFSTRGSRPSPKYAVELADLRQARDNLRAIHGGPMAFIGRSFGGRMCTFLAAQEPPAALVVLGYPIAPPGRPRPADEAALIALQCPTLIIQGDHDELGPLPVLQGIADKNPRIHLEVIPKAGHSYGKMEPVAVKAAVAWLAALLG